MYQTSETMVREFHKALDHPIGEKPGDIDDFRRMLRASLIGEEVTELLCAIFGLSAKQEHYYKEVVTRMIDDMAVRRGDANLVEIADGCCDVHYVVSGTAIEFGIPEDAVYAEVHRSNMAKQGGPTRPDGKTLKPEGWLPPDVAGVLAVASGTFGLVETGEDQAPRDA